MRTMRLSILVAVPTVVFGLSKLHAAIIASEVYDLTDSSRLSWAIAFTCLVVGGTYVAGLPALVEGPRSALVAAAAAVGGATLAISVVQLALGDALLPRFVVFGSALVLVPALSLLATVDVAGRQRAAQRDRVFFVGGEVEAAQLLHDLEVDAERPASLAGSITVGELVSSLDTMSLAERLSAANANLIVLDVSAQGSPDVVAQTALAHELGVRVRTLSLFYEQWLAKLPISELERVSLLFDVGELHRARYARVKRVADLLIGILGAVALIAVVPVVWVGNLIGNRGSLLFRQERVGKGGVAFTILKFRTMRPGGTDNSWTTADDPRITPFGGLLRRSHLDELPQMLNIVRGELSLVGPRPEQPRYVDELTEKLPFYRLRHLVRPGLTGWAQVKYGYAGDERDALEKLQYEFFYLRRQGLALDLRILGRTTRTVFGRGGR